MQDDYIEGWKLAFLLDPRNLEISEEHLSDLFHRYSHHMNALASGGGQPSGKDAYAMAFKGFSEAWSFLAEQHNCRAIVLKAALQEELEGLEQSLAALLKLPSRLDETAKSVYSSVLTLLLTDEQVPAPVRTLVGTFLESFHQKLACRRRVETWQYNGSWWAAPAGGTEADAVLGASEEEALEKLYVLYPELGQ